MEKKGLLWCYVCVARCDPNKIGEVVFAGRKVVKSGIKKKRAKLVIL